MKRWFLCVMFVLAGCQSTPAQTDQTTVLAGDYQAVANCFYASVATKPGYTKVDAPSTRTSTVEGGAGGSAPDKVEFIATGEGITKVHARMGTPAAWTGYLSTLKQCEETVVRAS